LLLIHRVEADDGTVLPMLQRNFTGVNFGLHTRSRSITKNV
jgi:hypothetical protein